MWSETFSSSLREALEGFPSPLRSRRPFPGLNQARQDRGACEDQANNGERMGRREVKSGYSSSWKGGDFYMKPSKFRRDSYFSQEGEQTCQPQR